MFSNLIILKYNQFLDNIPPKPSLPKTTLPVNAELMNDWIFCHNHSHEECPEQKKFDDMCRQLNATTIDGSSDRLRDLRPVLSTFDQIIGLLNEKNDSKFLFESKDKKFSLFLNIFNNQMIITSITNELKTNSDFLLKFFNKTSVFYKVFKTDEKEVNSELNRYRFAFDVRFFVTESQVMKTLMKTLIDSTKSVLPLDVRFDKDFEMFFGYFWSFLKKNQFFVHFLFKYFNKLSEMREKQIKGELNES